MNKISVQLGSVQETLLIPLLGRAVETQKNSGLIQDKRAVEIINCLDYDFSKWRNASKSLTGSVIRTRMFDADVADFLKAFPAGTVIEIGCGLNTRFERLDNGIARWFDLDLPDTIGLRRLFFEDSHRRTMIAASVLDPEWMEAVAATGGPWCFISEAAIIYLEAAAAKQAITQISARFVGAWFLIDTTAAAMVRSQATHDAMRHLPQQSWFRWICDDPHEIENWGIGMKLERSRTFLDAEPDLLRHAPWPVGWLARFAPWLIRDKLAAGYRLNKFVVE